MTKWHDTLRYGGLAAAAAGFVLLGASGAVAQEAAPIPPQIDSNPAPDAAALQVPAPAPVAPVQAPAPQAAASQATPQQAAPQAVVPSSLGGGSTIAGSNSSIGSAAASGAAIGSNGAAVGAGPSAVGIFGGAQTQQFGNNTVVVNQSSNVKSGDAVAGSQVVGAAGGGSTTVMNSNNSLGAIAVSGPAIGSNTAVAQAGPSAVGILGSGNVSQFGNNTTVLNQTNDARSGDAIAGSQVTGVVGSGRSLVMNQNSSVGALAFSGPALAPNFAIVNSGPRAIGLLGGANAGQVGNNDAILTQISNSRSGDAVAGSQVTGIVGGGLSFGSNFGLFPLAVSGFATGGNVALGGVGPQAGPVGLGFATTSQTGNNTSAATQVTGIQSGDGVSGSQVNGLVGQETGRLSSRSQRAPDLPSVVGRLN